MAGGDDLIRPSQEMTEYARLQGIDLVISCSAFGCDATLGWSDVPFMVVLCGTLATSGLYYRW